MTCQHPDCTEAATRHITTSLGLDACLCRQHATAAYNKATDFIYDIMPDNRLHACHKTNPTGIPVAWIRYEPNHGFELESTDLYGDGAIINITFCPWCGERLMAEEHEKALNWAGKGNRAGIKT